jgi:hypothetical protein
MANEAHRRLEAHVERHTAAPMAAAVGLGVALALGTLRMFDVYCADGATGLCGMILRQPPWLLVTGVAAAPSVLLTWYWRTTHKKRDRADAQRGQISTRFASAIGLLAQSQPGAVYALEQIARESPQDHWSVMETLAAFARRALPGTADLYTAREAVRIIGRRTVANDPPGASIDLRNTSLAGTDLSGGQFDGANFEGADLRNVDLDGASLRSARLARVDVGGMSVRGANLRGAKLIVESGGTIVYNNATVFDANSGFEVQLAISGRNEDGGGSLLARRLIAAGEAEEQAGQAQELAPTEPAPEE